MKVIHHSFARRSPRKEVWLVSRLVRVVVAALAIVGALHIIGAHPYASSTASTAPAVEPVATPAEYVYFPSQFVNQATEIAEPIEQF
jgi:anti-sigma-K factor RskA